MGQIVKENFEDYSAFINFIEENDELCTTKYLTLCFCVGYFGYVTAKTLDYLFRAYGDGFFRS